MSEQTPTETEGKKEEGKSQVEEPEKLEQNEQENWKDGEKFDAEKAQALIAKLRDEAKGKKALEKRVAEFEAKKKEQDEKDLTDLQKAEKRVAELEEENKKVKRGEMQRNAADKFKLPAEVAALLPGETQEEMEAKAEELAKVFTKTAPNLNANNPGAANTAITPQQRRDFLFGNGPLPK